MFLSNLIPKKLNENENQFLLNYMNMNLFLSKHAHSRVITANISKYWINLNEKTGFSTSIHFVKITELDTRQLGSRYTKSSRNMPICRLNIFWSHHQYSNIYRGRAEKKSNSAPNSAHMLCASVHQNSVHSAPKM